MRNRLIISTRAKSSHRHLPVTFWHGYCTMISFKTRKDVLKIIHHLADLIIAWTSSFHKLYSEVLFTRRTNPLTCSSSSREILSSLSRSYRRKATGNIKNIYISHSKHTSWNPVTVHDSGHRLPPPGHAHVTELYTHRAACSSCCWVARWQRRSCSSHCPRLVWSELRSAWNPWSLPGPL